MPDETDSRPHPSLELPEGTAILRNPVEEDLGDAVGFPEDSELLERHGRHFHLIEGANRTILEVTHFVEQRHGFHNPHLEQEKIVYLLPEGTSWLEARRIGYRLLARSPDSDGRVGHERG
jgi:hypothetical protein